MQIHWLIKSDGGLNNFFCLIQRWVLFPILSITVNLADTLNSRIKASKTLDGHKTWFALLTKKLNFVYWHTRSSTSQNVKDDEYITRQIYDKLRGEDFFPIK